MVDRLEAACHEGGTSCFTSGIDPGFANDLLPITLMGACERVESVRIQEILNYATYEQPEVLFHTMGFGQPLDRTPLLLLPGVLGFAWGGVIRMIAEAAGAELEEIREEYERATLDRDIVLPYGTVEAGTQAGLRFEVQGIVGGEPQIIAEHVTRIDDEVAPEWPSQEGGAGLLPHHREGLAEPRLPARDRERGRRPQHRRPGGHRHAGAQRDPGGRGAPPGRALGPRPADPRWSRLDAPDSAPVTPEEAAEATAPAVSGLSSHFMLDGETYAKGGELGFDGMDFYVAGRGGVLGDVDGDVVSAAFVFFEPGTVRQRWESSRPVMSRADAGAAFARCGHEWARSTCPTTSTGRAWPTWPAQVVAPGQPGRRAGVRGVAPPAGSRRRTRQGPRPAPDERAARAAHGDARRRGDLAPASRRCRR